MKFFVLMFVMALVPVSAKAATAQKGTIAYLDSRNGFLNATMGDSLAKHKANLVHIKDDGGMSMWGVKGDNMMGDIPIAMIYGFAENKLASIVVIVDPEYAQQLVTMVVSNYGRGEEFDKNKYRWMGKKVRLVLDGNDGLRLLFYNVPLHEKREAARNAAAANTTL